jgi:DNA-binding transcriptional LysR family regulator
MTKLVLGMAGYTISSGIMPKAYAKEVVAVPLELDENIRIGVVRRAEFSLSPAAERFLAAVRRRIPRKQSR